MSAAVDRKKKLGRGLGALMGEIQREEPLVRENSNDSNEVAAASAGASTSGLNDIPVADISPLPGQPRTHFDDEALDQLAASIAQRGVIQPIIVTPNGAGRYQLVAGERRWRAAQRARLHAIPAIVRDLDKREIMALALIENLQREDLNPLEEARAYQKLSDEEGMTQAEIAALVDKSRSHVANFQRLLALPEEVLEMLAKGKLTMGHARPLIGNEAAAEIARKAVNDNLSVREVEKLARGEKPKKAKAGGDAKPVSEAANDADIAAVQGHLEEFLGLPVRIKTEGAPGNGTVTIGYRTLDQLDLICQRLTGGDI
ncbi:chromosome partitioning protein [Gimesia maris DSM 8797]|uniref:ParB/RepB/Spo0J family partition protein n=1 Tax=Erythrobacter sp. SD-21 TaxID=161528 RepID=UPI000153F171|nr:ParB/RepB/Spo0J family partition protein [Erythrobacter sp. SD-21]EDL49817.1 chromosome partitioning protein [Erythrobacter sp. SD-21]EDL56003.1 chromosome partitioning protein [Gimesia maris DSM 8797]